MTHRLFLSHIFVIITIGRHRGNWGGNGDRSLLPWERRWRRGGGKDRQPPLWSVNSSPSERYSQRERDTKTERGGKKRERERDQEKKIESKGSRKGERGKRRCKKRTVNRMPFSSPGRRQSDVPIRSVRHSLLNPLTIIGSFPRFCKVIHPVALHMKTVSYQRKSVHSNKEAKRGWEIWRNKRDFSTKGRESEGGGERERESYLGGGLGTER